jgi:glycosyltransferase involved in cell wall biosynthesis
MQRQPLVSVIIPNFNHASFLKKRIDSILEQTFQNFELILLDDASTDGSDSILKSYAVNPKVSFVFINNSNSGSPFGMWEKGLLHAKGKYIWIAESDDWASPLFLEKLVPAFEDKDLMVSHCRSFDTNIEGEILQKNKWWDSFKVDLWKTNFVKDGTFLLNNYGKYKCPVINVSSAIVRFSAIQKVEIPYSHEFTGDWWFWAQLFSLGKVSFYAQPLNYIRIHINSATGKINSKNLQRINENFKTAKKISDLLNQKFKYHSNYSWLLNFLVEETVKDRNYLKYSYLSTPTTVHFKLILYRKIFLKLIARIINKTGL